MTASTLALFPGQGSQKVGMGKELYQSSPIAKKLFDTADQVLGLPLSQICFEGPIDKLTATEIAQPAILTVSVICFEIYRSLHPDAQFVAAAGHSLGEYSALVAAGALRFEDAVAIVNKRGKFMQEAVSAGAGAMVAVLGKELSELEDVLTKVSGGVAEIANINAPGQIVVAGDRAGIDSFCALLPGAKIIPLQVSAPFHCKLMKPAELRLAEVLKATTIHEAQFPVIANYNAKPVTKPAEILEALTLQVCGRVRWTECMEQAIAKYAPAGATEFGYGAVLSGMLKRIAPQLPRASFEGVEK